MRIAIALVLSALPFGAFAADHPIKPNILFILTDDQGFGDFSFTGNPILKTPNIDRLASQGMRFTNAYAACPVCSPTRASILTGRYPVRLHLTDWIPGRKQWPTAKLLTPEFRHELPLEAQSAAGCLDAGELRATAGRARRVGR